MTKTEIKFKPCKRYVTNKVSNILEHYIRERVADIPFQTGRNEILYKVREKNIPIKLLILSVL